MTDQQHIQQWEKTVTPLSTPEILKLIAILNIESLNDFKNKKALAAASVVIDGANNYLIMFFYRTGVKMVGFQYMIHCLLTEENTNTLCRLFTSYVLRIQRQTSIKQTHSVKNLSEYYALQIKGYKEHLQKPKQ